MTTRRWFGGLVTGLLVAGLVTYFAAVGLERADQTASVIAAVLAVLALAGPHLLPAARREPPPVRVRAGGAGAVAIGGDASAEVSTRCRGAGPAEPVIVSAGGRGRGAGVEHVDQWAAEAGSGRGDERAGGRSEPEGGVEASGTASVAVGGTSTAPIRTEVGR